MGSTFQMSQREIDRLTIMKRVISGELSCTEGIEMLSISRRQFFRIKSRVASEGVKGVMHRLRGRESNRGYPKSLKEEVLRLYKQQYNDYGPTLFSEQLLAYHGIEINHETLRRWMRSRSIMTSIRKLRPHRRKRERRSFIGEMVQFDGSDHDWFEGRGARCTLLLFVDDASSRVYMKFARSENTYDVLTILWEYILLYGIPRSLYLDRCSVYYSEGKLTDFGRACKELNIDVIYAKSPQAKGRVERNNRTLQDRLVKALRTVGASTIEEANRYLRDSFISSYNGKFASSEELPDVHRSPLEIELANILCYKTTRQVRNDNTINLGGGYIQLLLGRSPLPGVKQEVMISRRLNGEMHIYFNGQELDFKELSRKPEKKGYNNKPVAIDHPWRRQNKRIKGGQKNLKQLG